MKKFLALLFSFCILFSCDKEDPVVTQISFDSESLTLQIGSSTTLNVNHTPSDLVAPTYSWKSSNSNIVSVTQSGVISALELGDATITVTTETALTTSCVVTVLPIDATSIKLSDNDLTIDVGDSHELTYEILPNDTTDKSVNWSSSDDEIATVEDGVITAISEGVAQIKVELSNGVYDICELFVNNVDVENISLFVSKLTIEETETAQLYATITPSNATNCEVVWTSSDTSVATVDDSGTVTGVKIGTATITATTVDGGYIASCELTVTEISVKAIALEWKSIKLAIGETYTLASTISPYNAANQNISWASSSSSVVAVDSKGGLTALSQGGVTISAKSEDGGFKASCYVEVKSIDEYLVLDACAGNMGFGIPSSNAMTFDLNDRLYNPTSLPITINSYFFILDSPFEFATGYPGGDIINKGEYKYNKFEDNIAYFTSNSISATDAANAIARYKIRYYFSCNGESYILEKSYNEDENILMSASLNKTPTISNWWE